MKKGMAVLTALVIVGCCPGGMTAEASRKEENGKEEAGNRQESYILNQALLSETDWENAYELLNKGISGNPKMDSTFLNPEGMPLSGEDLEEMEISGEDVGDEEKKQDADRQAVKTLEMPQKLEVIIDPWEVDGKGQVHSEQYVIQNTGENAGVLTLSGLTCRPREGSNVSVRTDRDGLHDDERKSVYMEMVFGTGERIVLSEEGVEYNTELKPGEEVTLEFTGEVNEHASGNWDNRDVAVDVVYSWKQEEGTADVSGDVLGDRSGDVSGDVTRDESGDRSGDVSGDVTERVLDVSGDVAIAEPDTGVQEPSDNDLNTSLTEPSEDGRKDGENGKEGLNVVIDLSGDAEIVVDSWTADMNERLTSIQYVMRNIGNVPGTLKLFEPVCKLRDQSEAIVRIKMNSQDTGGMEYTGKECIWIELTGESGEKQSDQENLEATEYKAELKPGEEIVICFLVSSDRKIQEDLKNGKAVMELKYSWKPKEVAAPGL